MSADYYSGGGGGLIGQTMSDQPTDTAEWTNKIYPAGTGEADLPPAQTGQSIDYTSIAESLGLGLVDTLTSNYDDSPLSSLMVEPAAKPGEESFAQMAKTAFNKISGDQWANLLGGIAKGAAGAYFQTKALDIGQQNADTNRKALELKQSQDRRAAESATNLKWRMGLIGKKS